MGTGSPPQYQTQNYQLLSTHNPTRSLSRNAGLSVSYTNYLTPPQTTSVASLKLHNPPHSTLALAALKFRFSILLLRKATVFWLKVYTYFCFTYIYLSDTHPHVRQCLGRPLKRRWCTGYGLRAIVRVALVYFIIINGIHTTAHSSRPARG